MEALLRRHGATIVERGGQRVAADYGSVAGEEAVCRTHVGLAERPDRVTFDLRGDAAELDGALADPASRGARLWSDRVSPQRAIVRCERSDEPEASARLGAFEGLTVLDVTHEYVAIELVGPFAEQVAQAAGVAEEDAVIVLREGEHRLELLAARSHGPALWNRMLDAGERFGISCVGLDALERLAVSERVGRLRQPAEQLGG